MTAGTKSEHYKCTAEHLLVCNSLIESSSKLMKKMKYWTRKASLDLCALLSMVLQAVFETRLKDMAMAVPLMCCAADMISVPSRKEVVLVGQKSSLQFDSMLAAAHTLYDPNKTVSECASG